MRVLDARVTSELVHRYEGYFQRADTRVEFWQVNQDGEYGVHGQLASDSTAKVTRVKLGVVNPRAILKHGVFTLSVCGKSVVEVPLHELDGDGLVLTTPVYIAARMGFRPAVRIKDMPAGGMVELFLCGEITQDAL
jgi:hypothetical protein